MILQFITTTMLTNQCENSQYNEFIQLLDTTNVVDSQHNASEQILILLIDLFTSTKSNIWFFSQKFLNFSSYLFDFRKPKTMETC